MMTSTTRNRFLFLMVVIVLAFLLAGCADFKKEVATDVKSAITFGPATATQCPAGGTNITVDGISTGVVCNGVAGADGATVIGPTGPAGSTGATGDAGAPGIPGTTITVVKFCPETPSYGTFPENGLCINNRLYAVYSIPGAFLTLLSPGLYRSDAIGSACTFSVRANCEVVR